MLNGIFEMFIPHYIMEYVGNLCSPCLLREQPKDEHKTIICVAYGFSACVITNKSIFDKSVRNNSFEASKVVDKHSDVTNCHSFMH